MISALLKSVHPDWSPAAIKSAIMTTADQTNLGNQPILDQSHLAADVYSTGAGHVNPARANDPGLVYDIEPQDYRKVNCSAESRISEGQLNYPSFSVRSNESADQMYTRTVTNVGEAGSSYNVEVVAPQGIDVIVEPRTLHFTEVNQKLRYKIKFRRSANTGNTSVLSHGYVLWKSAKHSALTVSLRR
ncbi:hypothetical protein MIMGU_mgv11b015879mg [Erythranthe guttata]|uniref:Subtilisin-like protease fibronectin type-III domain-containing protein n=1 Tax=Erythranthe guttata TaxID=4155 RepID=A0A022Q7R1_ERYGU|nr:hypothetical protein MIMGU_mgv11b015879mg [Erythranthe guttata]